MKRKTQTEIANQIHQLSLEVFRVYNSVVRTPINWQKERERLARNPNSRATWKYRVPSNIEELKSHLIGLKNTFGNTYEVESNDRLDVYKEFLPDVVEATLKTALVKCDILKDLKNSSFKTTLELRKEFYSLDYNYSKIENIFLKISQDDDIKHIGRELGRQTIFADEAAEIVKKSIEEVRSKIETVIPFLPKYREKILGAFTAEVEVIDDPSFTMRCITDPITLITKVLLNKRRKYSPVLLKIAYLHEFCGHALEMAVFDKTLVKNKVISEIYSYAGVSSPSIFDVKAEVFADLIVAPFIQDSELKFISYRSSVWLICRAMADYLYNIKGKTIKDVMKIYETVGLEDFAFDEAIMASLFIDGYQGMYLFANKKIKHLQKENDLNDKDLLTLLLYMGKIPIVDLKQFKQNFRLIC